MSLRPRRAIATLALASIFVPFTASADDPAEATLDRASVLRAAVTDHPSIEAGAERARAASLAAEAEGRLPPPETMFQIWQVPITRPYALADSQMIMFGVGQTFPAPGARGARRRAGEKLAEAERAMTNDRARQVRAVAEHAFVDYAEAEARHRVHLEHRSITERMLSLARARHAGGAALGDVAQTEVELARIDADVAADEARAAGAAARLNALLGRPGSSVLGRPRWAEIETSAWPLDRTLARAREARPEIAASRATAGARAEETRAAEKEATIPTFGVAVLYFAPTNLMPEHGYGLNASMTLPWLWGDARARRDAAKASAVAAAREARALERPIDGEVAAARAAVDTNARRVAVLRDRAVPASRRAFDVAWAGYESARTDVLALLVARRAIVDVESDLIGARAALDHALAELDAAAGLEVPRRPLDATPATDGGDHGR